jgi:hypothetical protein
MVLSDRNVTFYHVPVIPFKCLNMVPNLLILSVFLSFRLKAREDSYYKLM